MNSALLIISFSFGFICLAVAITLFLIRLTGLKSGWILLLLAISLMSVRRFVLFYSLLKNPFAPFPYESEIIALLISICMAAAVTGIYYIIKGVKYEEEVNKIALDTIMEGVVVLNKEEKISFFNSSFLQEFGYKAEEIPFIDFKRLFQEDNNTLYLPFSAFVKNREKFLTGFKFETVAVTSKGYSFPAEFSVKAFLLNNEPYFVVVIRNISKQKETEKKLRKLALRDYLTGVLNRRGFEEELKKIISYSLRYHHSFLLLFLDLDGFKKINDCFGHLNGDKFLMGLCGYLKDNLREGDILGRLGGDEFGIIFPEIEAPIVANVVQRIDGIIKDYKFSVKNKEISLEASIGYALFPKDGKNYQELLRYADNMMYEAKKKKERNGDSPIRTEGR